MQNIFSTKNAKFRISKTFAKAAMISLLSGLSYFMFPTTVSAEKVTLFHWSNAPSMPYRVQEIYPTVFDGHIVVAGGLSPDVDENRIGVSDRVLFFSIKDKTWKDGQKLPEPRHHAMLVTVGKRLFSFGGFVVDGKGAWHNSLDVLELIPEESPQADILNGQWKKVSELPGPLAETLSAVNNGVVHLVTGRTPANADNNSQWNDQTDVSTHYQFDVTNFKWSEGKKAPTARNSACSVQTNDKLFTIAGRTVTGGNLSSHEAYDFSSEKWQTLAPLPQAQGGLACAISGERIYVFGGEYFNNGGGVYSEVWEYHMGADKWRAVSEMPNPRHGLGALSIDGKIYVIAGASEAGGNKTSGAMTVFTPDAD